MPAGLKLEPVDGSSQELKAALEHENLPVEDLSETGRMFFRILHGKQILGFAGFELYGENIFIRSVVIASQWQGQGFGKQAVTLLLEHARASGARHGYLLTSSAAPFFEALGFTRIDRAAAPAVILQTRQASGLCASSAALLTCELRT